MPNRMGHTGTTHPIGCRSLPGRLAGLFRRVGADRRGTIAVTVAIALPALLGATGLAVDLGQWYHERATLQLAADAAAMGAARLLTDTSATTDNYQTVALAEAEGAIGHGTAGTLATPVSVTLNGDQSVQVALTSTATQFFTGALGLPAPTLTATATAGRIVVPGCVISLSATAEKAIDVENNASISAPNCSVFSNSDVVDPNNDSIYVQNGSITADSVAAVGGVEAAQQGQSIISPSPTEGNAPITDPYASLAPPTVGSSCTPYPTPTNGGTTIELSPGTYCSIAVANNTTINFKPGLYIIDNGDFTIANGSTIGSAAGDNTGVTFYMGGTSPGSIQWDNNTQTAWQLAAPTSGPYAGILIYQDRSTPASSPSTSNDCGGLNPPRDVIAGGSGLTLNGTLYMPSVNLQISNNADLTNPLNVNGSFNVIANTITMCGHAQLNAAGGTPSGALSSQIVLLQ
jgi:Flp pilus assembly protein TadG